MNQIAEILCIVSFAVFFVVTCHHKKHYEDYVIERTLEFVLHLCSTYVTLKKKHFKAIKRHESSQNFSYSFTKYLSNLSKYSMIQKIVHSKRHDVQNFSYSLTKVRNFMLVHVQ